MKIFRSAIEVTQYVHESHQKGLSVGFTPTMGALHEGHFSLVRWSLEENDLAISSIFVNPTQFNDQGDLEKYPRTEKEDCDQLKKIGCHAVFIPPVDEIYPEGLASEHPVDLDGLDEVMEGVFRPGHFQGVVRVMRRLLDIIPCDALYMGQKDWQQVTIVRFMLLMDQSPVRLVIVPTIRETDGLAKSSRNRRLTDEFRCRAPLIYRVLLNAKAMMKNKSPGQIEESSREYLQGGGLEPEYFDIVDGLTLKPITEWPQGGPIVACTAVWAGDVRLIDNMILRE